jgi:tetratricopeptide (TPR) repeat protein
MGAAPNPAAQIQADVQRAFGMQQAGKLTEALALYEQVLKRAPFHPDALAMSGMIASQLNDHARAVDLIRRAAFFRPRDAAMLNNLGNACLRDGRYDEAIEPLERAIALKPDLAEAYGNLIIAHRYAGHVEEALHYIEALRRLKGPSVTSENEAARLYADMGKRDEARAILQKLTKDHPEFGSAWMALADTQKVKPGDPLLDDILAAIEKASEPSVTMKFLCFAAGKALDDLGEYDRAFGHYARAKAQEPYLYDPADMEKQFNAVKRVFDETFFRAREQMGVDADRPIFIVGMPRSGTTLAEQILSSHRDVAGGGELQYLGAAVARTPEYALSDTAFPECARALTENGVAGLAFLYLRQVAALNLGKPRVTDKMPHNFKHLGMIALMFRNARIVHTLRHPFDNCLSCYMHDFGIGHAYNRNLEGLAHYYNLYRDLMIHWANVLPTEILHFQYEDVLNNQRARTEALLGYAGLDWDDSAMAFHETERRVGTPSNWQVRAPLYKTSDGRWRNYEKHLAPLMDGIKTEYLP